MRSFFLKFLLVVMGLAFAAAEVRTVEYDVNINANLAAADLVDVKSASPYSAA